MVHDFFHQQYVNFRESILGDMFGTTPEIRGFGNRRFPAWSHGTPETGETGQMNKCQYILLEAP